MTDLVKVAVGISVGLLVAAVVLSIGVAEVYNVDTTGWDSAVKTIFTVLFPVLAVLAVALKFMPSKGTSYPIIYWPYIIYSKLKRIGRKAQAGLKEIVAIAVGILVAAILFPPAYNEILQTNTTTWNSAVSTIFSTLLPILAIIGLALYFLRR